MQQAIPQPSVPDTLLPSMNVWDLKYIPQIDANGSPKLRKRIHKYATVLSKKTTHKNTPRRK